MITRLPDYAAIENEVVKDQLTDGLRNALDRGFRRLLTAAQAEWESKYSGNDPSDACVSVRIHSDARALTGPFSSASESLVPDRDAGCRS